MRGPSLVLLVYIESLYGHIFLRCKRKVENNLYTQVFNNNNNNNRFSLIVSGDPRLDACHVQGYVFCETEILQNIRVVRPEETKIKR